MSLREEWEMEDPMPTLAETGSVPRPHVHSSLVCLRVLLLSPLSQLPLHPGSSSNLHLLLNQESKALRSRLRCLSGGE